MDTYLSYSTPRELVEHVLKFANGSDKEMLRDLAELLPDLNVEKLRQEVRTLMVGVIKFHTPRGMNQEERKLLLDLITKRVRRVKVSATFKVSGSRVKTETMIHPQGFEELCWAAVAYALDPDQKFGPRMVECEDCGAPTLSKAKGPKAQRCQPCQLTARRTAARQGMRALRGR